MTLRDRTMRLVFTALLIAIVQFTSLGHARVPEEYRLKAAFLYNFIKFVEWPSGAFADPTSPMVVCVLAGDQFFEAIRSLEGKTVDQRMLTIRRMARAEDAGQCHVLFIDSSERDRAGRMLESVGNRAVLTVSDMEGFVRSGGMIGLIESGNRIRFEINVAGARFAGLKISSKLLRLADTIVAR